MSRPRLEDLEAAGFEPGSGDLLVAIAWLTIESVPLDEHELKAARRRAMFVLAAGGDPNREIDFDSVAAERLGDELDSPARREALAAALAGLEIEGLPRVSEAVHTLQSAPDLAWRSFGLALLADELADE